MTDVLTVAAVQPAVIEEAKDGQPIGYVVYVREDAVAQILGIEKIFDAGDGTFDFQISWLHKGKLTDHFEAVYCNENSLTHDGKPMIFRHADTLEGLGFDAEDTQSLLTRGIKLPGYRPERNKANRRYRKSVGKR